MRVIYRSGNLRFDPLASSLGTPLPWLTKAAVQKNTRAMGLLSTLLFSRKKDAQDMIDAYTWSHLAAEYDPIQFTTSTRALIEQYCTPEQIKEGKKSIAQWKKKWK